jgi:hypothetical protein
MRHGPHTTKTHTGLLDHGSRKRISRLTLRRNSPPEVWVLLVGVLLVIGLLLIWLSRNPADGIPPDPAFLTNKY